LSLYQTLMDFAYDVTCKMLNVDPATNPQYITPLDMVESIGALEDPHSNCIFYLVSFDNTSMNEQVETASSENSNTALVTQTMKYVRNLKIDWQIYGDDGFEWADTLRIKLFDPTIKSLFAAQGISLILPVKQAIFFPEKIGQQWYHRYDLRANFNQRVIKESNVDAIASTNIIIEDKKGVVSQCSVSIP
jgi:hypothetical protein